MASPRDLSFRKPAPLKVSPDDMVNELLPLLRKIATRRPDKLAAHKELIEMTCAEINKTDAA